MSLQKNTTLCENLGARLKEYREKRGLKQNRIAKLSGISTSMLSQIETSSVSPSVNTLVAVCNALGLDVAELFKSVIPKKPVDIFKPSQTMVTDDLISTYELLVPNILHENIGELFKLTVKTGQKKELKGVQSQVTLIGHVLEGNAELTIDSVTYSVMQGDSIRFPVLKAHKFENVGSTPFVTIWGRYEVDRNL